MFESLALRGNHLGVEVASVILSAAKDLVGRRAATEILRCAQDDGCCVDDCSVDGYTRCRSQARR